MGKGWTKERRAAQAARCRENKPWEHVTGSKTAAGKARCSMNAFKSMVVAQSAENFTVKR